MTLFETLRQMGEESRKKQEAAKATEQAKEKARRQAIEHQKQLEEDKRQGMI